MLALNKNDADRCEYCKRLAKHHSGLWQTLPNDDPRKKTEEQSDKDVVYGIHALVGMYKEFKGKIVTYAGERVEQIVCNECWEKGKRWKKKKKKSSS